MSRESSRYFELRLESLRAIGGWAADCAEQALVVFETHSPQDPRPREALLGIREFARGGKRAARLRTLATAANAAAREVGHAAAAAAARAAGLAAASAYTHPLVDVQQTKHIVGPAAYAALSRQLDSPVDSSIAASVIRWAIENAPAEVREVLLQMPARRAGKTRLESLLYELDSGIRMRPANHRNQREQLS